MTKEKELKILDLRNQINTAIYLATIAAQETGRHTLQGELDEFFAAQSEERKKTNKVIDLVEDLVKEVLNEDN